MAKDVAAADRKRWLSLLAKAEDSHLERLWTATGLSPSFRWLRSPQSGTVMVRGRAGATGAPFNLGEMTVTRSALRLETGEIGHGYVSGRSKRKSEIAALCDALLQVADSRAEKVDTGVISPLEQAASAAVHMRAEKAAATKVEFFTLERGAE
ncbi:MAG: phosphonate C-P lyase system protein PhnG [Pseudomonadota bacterium]